MRDIRQVLEITAGCLYVDYGTEEVELRRAKTFLNIRRDSILNSRLKISMEQMSKFKTGPTARR